jgi:hypothetical protein
VPLKVTSDICCVAASAVLIAPIVLLMAAAT